MTYINFISKPFVKNGTISHINQLNKLNKLNKLRGMAKIKQFTNPFITQKFIRECPYIGTKICDSFYYFKTRTQHDILPDNPMVGYFKHNIKRKNTMRHSPLNMHQSTPIMYQSNLDCNFTMDTFINVGKNL